MHDIVKKLEAFLFADGSDVLKKTIMEKLAIDANQLALAVNELRKKLDGHAIALVESDSSLSLRSSQDQAEFLKEVHAANLSGDIGKAGLEVLAIVLYKGPCTHADIDYIRGVNSSYSIRNLMMRGLLEKVKAEGGQYIYKPTVELFAQLGIDSLDKLPNREKVSAEIKQLEEQKNNETC